VERKQNHTRFLVYYYESCRNMAIFQRDAICYHIFGNHSIVWICLYDPLIFLTSNYLFQVPDLGNDAPSLNQVIGSSVGSKTNEGRWGSKTD